MRRVVRWEVPVDGSSHVLPLTGEVLHVDCREPQAVEVWTYDSGGPIVPTRVQVFGTGHELPEGAGPHEYLGTALTPDATPYGPPRGALVWHLFRVAP